MFDAIEQKLLIDTVNKRRAWMAKTLTDSNIDDKTTAEYKATLRVLDSALKKLEKITPTKTFTPTSPPAPPKKRQKHSIPIGEAHILIAEDDPDSAMLLEGIIQDFGIKNIVIARDGREAVNELKNASPAFDIVLCDWDMPELNGLEVRKQVRHLARLQDTHFIMVTAVSEAARIKQAIGEGITDYIVKPVDAETLEKKIKIALAGDSPPSTQPPTASPQAPNSTTDANP